MAGRSFDNCPHQYGSILTPKQGDMRFKVDYIRHQCPVQGDIGRITDEDERLVEIEGVERFESIALKKCDALIDAVPLCIFVRDIQCVL